MRSCQHDRRRVGEPRGSRGGGRRQSRNAVSLVRILGRGGELGRLLDDCLEGAEQSLGGLAGHRRHVLRERLVGGAARRGHRVRDELEELAE